MDRRKNLAAALPSPVSMFSLRATMPMFCSVRSAWMRTPSSKFRLNRSRKATARVSPDRETGHQFPPAGAPQGAAGGDVGKDQVFTDAVVDQQAELGLQVPGLVVGLADPGVAVGDGEQGHGNQAASAGQRPSAGSVQKTGVFEHPPPAPRASFGQVFNNPVQQ